MTKKGIGVKKWNHAERDNWVFKSKQKKWVLTMPCLLADRGKSSHMTSLPQHELSEGFENVNFLKNV